MNNFGKGKTETIRDKVATNVISRIGHIRDIVNGYLNGKGIIDTDFTFLFMLAIKDDILHVESHLDYLSLFCDLDIASDIYGCIMNEGYLLGGVVLHFEQMGHEDLMWAIDMINSKTLNASN